MEIELPFFEGFYESRYYNYDMEYYEIREDIDHLRELYGDDKSEDDFELDFGAYTHEVCIEFVNAFANYTPEFVKGVSFSETSSPRYYNFSTDKIYAYIELEDGWKDKVIGFMDANREWLDKRISDEWTSYDGFMSFMDDTFSEWRARFTNDTYDERYVACMIGYMMLKENQHVRDDIFEDTFSDLGLYQFIVPTDGVSDETNDGEKVSVRIKFSADIVLEGDSIDDVRTKWESMELFSDDAKKCGVEYSETLLIEDSETYEDLSEKWKK